MMSKVNETAERMADTVESVAAKTAEDTVERMADAVENIAAKTKKEVGKLGGRARLREVFGKTEITLSKPFTWCGETYETVTLDFSSLTGRDMEAVDEQIGMNRMQGRIPAYSRLYQRLLCARACPIPSDGIEHLPIADYNAMVTAAQNFLLVTG